MNMGISNVQQDGRIGSSSGTPKKDSSTMGKDDFLKLLMTQLQHQDPTNPVDNNAMLAQLAQFSALEQQQRTGDLTEMLVVLTQRNEQLAATGYIGKTVRAKGFEIAKEKDSVSTVYYSSNQKINEGKINVYNLDKEIVYSEDLGSKQPGFYEFKWDGKSSTGKDLPDGKYTIAIQAKTEEGQPILVHTEVSGEVISSVTENGNSYLRLKDGRVVELKNIYEVYDPSLKPKPEGEGDGSEKPKPEGEGGTEGGSGARVRAYRNIGM